MFVYLARVQIDFHYKKILDLIENYKDNKFSIKNILWFDLNVQSFENLTYQVQIKNSFKTTKFYAFNNLNKLEEFVFSLKSRSLLICNGKDYQSVFDKFYFSIFITDILLFRRT